MVVCRQRELPSYAEAMLRGSADRVFVSDNVFAYADVTARGATVTSAWILVVHVS